MALTGHRIQTFKNVSDLEFFINTAAVKAVLTSGAHTFNFTFGAVGETLIIEGSVDGGATFTAFRRTFTVGDAGPHANIAALLSELNTAARWDGGTLPSADNHFVITNVGDTLLFTHDTFGPSFALRVSPESTALGTTDDEDIQLVAETTAKGNKGSVGLLTVANLFSDDNGTLILVYTV